MKILGVFLYRQIATDSRKAISNIYGKQTAYNRISVQKLHEVCIINKVKMGELLGRNKKVIFLYFSIKLFCGNILWVIRKDNKQCLFDTPRTVMVNTVKDVRMQIQNKRLCLNLHRCHFIKLYFASTSSCKCQMCLYRGCKVSNSSIKSCGRS